MSTDDDPHTRITGTVFEVASCQQIHFHLTVTGERSKCHKSGDSAKTRLHSPGRPRRFSSQLNGYRGNFPMFSVFADFNIVM